MAALIFEQRNVDQTMDSESNSAALFQSDVSSWTWREWTIIAVSAFVVLVIIALLFIFMARSRQEGEKRQEQARLLSQQAMWQPPSAEFVQKLDQWQDRPRTATERPSPYAVPSEFEERYRAYRPDESLAATTSSTPQYGALPPFLSAQQAEQRGVPYVAPRAQ